MNETEERIIKVLEEIRDTLVKQEKDSAERQRRFMQESQELANANSKQYEDTQRAYRQALEQQQTSREKPNAIAMMLIGVIALCLVIDLILRFLAR